MFKEYPICRVAGNYLRLIYWLVNYLNNHSIISWIDGILVTWFAESVEGDSEPEPLVHNNKWDDS